MKPEDIAKKSESSHQQALFAWAALEKRNYPQLQLMFAIPNQRAGVVAGARFKAEGVRSGVPDLMLPAARGGWHGLFLELKKEGGKIADNQRFWLDELTKQGYYCDVVYGWQNAVVVIETYLKL